MIDEEHKELLRKKLVAIGWLTVGLAFLLGMLVGQLITLFY